MNYSQDNTTKIKKNIKSNKKKAKNKAGVLASRIILTLVLILGFSAAGGLIGAYFGILQGAPKLGSIKITPNIYTSILYDSKGNEIDRLKGEENREYVTFDRIPQNLKNAFISIEDERFYQHDGIDFRGMARALYTQLVKRENQGASTITQQLIKNSVMKIPRNTLITKLQEQYLALQYEKMMLEEYGTKQAVKDYILEVYLNTIGLGHNINGVQTAAYYYFNKDVSELTLSECAVIAAITQLPTRYSPILNPDKNRDRRDVVLDQMLKLGYINEAEHKEAIEDDLYARITESEQITAFQESYHSYFVDQVILDLNNALRDKFNMSSAEAYNYIYNGGLQIYTTLDTEMQEIMDESFSNDAFFPAKDYKLEVHYYLSVKNNITDKTTHYERRLEVKDESEIEPWTDSVKAELVGPNDTVLAERHVPIPQPQAAMVIMDHHNGHVKALIGGRGEKMMDLGLNRAIASERQPGSTFKVLGSYAPAIDLGLISPSTILVDEPYTYLDYTPKNWYEGYRGAASVRDGIRNSMNILAVKNIVNTGIDTAMDYLINFGFTTLITETTYIGGSYKTDRGPAALALGGLTNGVTQLELCAAYAAIANEGEYNKPIFYTKVLDHDGVPILEIETESHQVIKKASAYILTDMMKSVITSGTGGKAAFKSSSMPIAGKTGTASETKDLVFAGYTPYYTASIWMGFDQPAEMKQDEGFHLRLWSDIMEKIHVGLPIKQFEKTDGVTTASVCSDSGKLAVSGLCENDIRGSRIITDIFMVGTQPTEYCDAHIAIEIDSVSYKRFGPECSAESRERIIGVINRSPDAVLSPDAAWSIPESFLTAPYCDEHGYNYYEPNFDGPIMPETESGYQSFENLYNDSQPENPENPTMPPYENDRIIIGEEDDPVYVPAAVTPMPAAITTLPPTTEPIIFDNTQPVMEDSPTATPQSTPTAVPEYSRTPLPGR